jgi:regulator of nonsense transcripts 3
VHARAYIAFKTEELVARFSREYDGHVFKDKAGVHLAILVLWLTLMRLLEWTQGNESRAVVEFAPYQKLPLEKKKVDNRNATIDQGMLGSPCHLS